MARRDFLITLDGEWSQGVAMMTVAAAIFGDIFQQQ
jgi:hypothetical protein